MSSSSPSPQTPPTTSFRPDGGLVSWFSSSRSAASAMSSTYTPQTPKPTQSTSSTTFPHPDGHLTWTPPPPSSSSSTSSTTSETRLMPDGHLIPPSSSSTKETSSTTSVQVADGHLMPPTETSTRIMPDGGLVYSSSSTTGSGSNMGSATPSGSLSMVSVHGDSSAVSMPRSSNDIIDDADAGVQLVLSAALVVAICIVRML